MKKTYNVVAAIIVKDDRILCAKRNHGYFKGKWEFPGGKIEVYETNEYALIREIKEELGIQVNVERYYMGSNYEYQDFIINLSTYLCRYNEGCITLVDHSDIVWKEIIDMKDLEWCEADEIIVKALLEEKEIYF